MADNTGAIDKLLTKEYTQAEEVRALNEAAKAHRWHGYKQRRSLMERLRKAERANTVTLAQITKLGSQAPASLYSPKQQQIIGGLNIRVEISLDGLTYSNPGPTIPNSAHIWVRAIIDEAHRGEAGFPKTHEMCHVTWSYYSGFHKLDIIPASGHDEFFVSYPLTLTREFTAPSSGSTHHDFFVYVDLYEPINASIGVVAPG